jgi:hypothetical protein
MRRKPSNIGLMAVAHGSPDALRAIIGATRHPH